MSDKPLPNDPIERARHMNDLRNHVLAGGTASAEDIKAIIADIRAARVAASAIGAKSRKPKAVVEKINPDDLELI